MKKITSKTILRQGEKEFKPVVVAGVVYWIDNERNLGDVVFNKVSGFIYKIEDKNTIASYESKIVAQSSNRLKGVPVVSLDGYLKKKAIEFAFNIQTKEFTTSWLNAQSWFIAGHNSNPNHFTLKDIERAIELSYKMGYVDRDKDIGYGSNLPYCKEQITSIQSITVNKKWEVVRYE